MTSGDEYQLLSYYSNCKH